MYTVEYYKRSNNTDEIIALTELSLYSDLWNSIHSLTHKVKGS